MSGLNPVGGSVFVRADRLQRWRDAAQELGDAGKKLAGELAKLSGCASREELATAALSARDAQQQTSGVQWYIANATAAELECAAA